MKHFVLALLFLCSTLTFSQVLKKSNDSQPTTNLIVEEFNKQIKAICEENAPDMVYQLEAVYSELDRVQKIDAESYALLRNIPTKIYHDDGSFSELMRLSDKGLPVYYKIDNVDAAVSSRANFLNTGGGLGLNLDGDGMIVHVWDGGPTRPTHQEFDGAGGNNRVSIIDGVTALNGNSFHAQHVTGTIVASGFSPNAKGMSWQADARTNEWSNDLSEATTAAANGMILSNHSYGNNINFVSDDEFGQYGSAARNWDALMYSRKDYLMVKSAGNDGNNNSANGAPLGGNSAYDKLSGNATAKNNLVIANANDANINGTTGALISVTRNSGSSEGPTDDLRIKPDIAGNGTGLYSSYDNSDSAYNTISGTSMSAPNVTGTLLLLQEYYQDLHGTTMKAATLKGLALHTADDIAPNGPDAETGWGLINSKKAAETITANPASTIISELTLSQGETYQVTVQADGVNPLLASISWTDPAGNINNGTNSSTPALINDLDIRLSNGSTFMPWRLTSVNTNGTGDNTVDPFERVDVVGASGQYTLTVTHKGSLSSGSQDYSLIITGGVIAASTPVISYASTAGNATEDTDCAFTDYNVDLNIGVGASANADVNFTINGSSTATSGVDFDLLTSSVTFPAGSTATQTMTFRVYHDAFVESDETIIIDFTVDANGGDATANASLDTYTFTLLNDDVVPPSTENTTLFTEDFEDLTGWINRDGDGDGNVYEQISFSSGGFTGFANNFIGSETDLTILGGAGAGSANANNYFISPAITIPDSATDVQFNFSVAGFNSIEHYALYWSTNISSNATINSSVLLEERDATADVGDIRSVNSTSIEGETGHFVIRHYNSSANNGILLIDGVSIVATVNTSVQTAVNSGTPDELNINGTGTAYASDPGSGNVMVAITNNNSFDYGCADVSVSRAGTSAQSYNGSTAPNLVTDKTFTINPENTTGSGSVDLTFYFSEVEIAGWETTTGLNRNALVAARNNGTVETASLTIGNFGSNVTLTGNFSGIDGTYYFGPETTFLTCPGVLKIWNGVSWLPLGDPTNIDSVSIEGDYDTVDDGNIEACDITINTGVTLTVNPLGYIRSQGDITVNGTLNVTHTGSVVQVNSDAVVNKASGATINVHITSPVLQTRDFMVLGSPMDAETRNGVYDSAFSVMQHTPDNFNPHDHPNIPQGATNFKDKEGDFWAQYTGAITVGEGFIVRPQSGFTDPANTTYDLTYSQGTLNSGEIARTIVYNGTNSPLGTPNIISNPYASGISADAFITDNSLNALYFWEHLTPPTVIVPGESIMFDMGDVSIRNLGGGNAANNGGNVPGNVIATGQGFAVKATASGSVNFTNSMRVTTGNTTLRTVEENADRLWLRIESDKYETGNNLMIGFNPEATSGWDQGYDTERLASMVSIYSQLDSDDVRMAIQTRGMFDSAMKIPVGFSTLIEDDDTSYTISLSDYEGKNLLETAIYLFDNDLNILTNLKEQEYTFQSGVATYDRRFTLFFESENLGITTQDTSSIVAYPNPTKDVLTIVAPNTSIEKVALVDMLGRTIQEYTLNNVQSYQLDMSAMHSALYFVEIVTPAGTITKRIVKE